MSRSARSLTRVIRSDPEFDRLRGGWNQRFHANPLEVVFPVNTDEVSIALQDARERRIPFRVRSGGHSVDGFSEVDDGITIDLRALHSIEISEDAAQARIGAGAQIHPVYEVLATAGRVIPGGVGYSVGLGGLITGGGVGGLARWLGALAHNVVSFDIVDADGDVLHVTADSHPDLYWACLGAGGGNFGIITTFTLHLTPLSTVVWYRLSWPWSQFEQVYDTWQRWAPAADPRLTPLLVMWPTTAANRIDVGGVFPGAEEELEPLLHPLLDVVPTPAEAETTPTTFVAAMAALLQKIAAASFDASTRAATASPFFDQPLTPDAFHTLREWHTTAPGNSFVWSLPGGGRLADAARRGTESFAHGDSTQLMLIRSDWTDPRDDKPCTTWVNDLYQQVRPQATGTYLNWTNTDIESRPHLLYRNHFPRLVEIKHRYDPDTVFDFEHAIPAAVSPAQAQQLGLPAHQIAELHDRGRLIS